MSFQCPRSPLQALYRIFVLPTLSPSLPARAVLPFPRPPRNTRTLSSTPPKHVKTRATARRTQKWDHEITARQVYIVDPVTSQLSQRARPTRHVLRDLDSKTHRLVQISRDDPDDPDFTPVCKIISKEEIFQSAQRKKETAREARRSGVRGGDDQMKTIELNWAIDMNDLGHRLLRAKEFLAEGRRVEVVLAAKRRGRVASAEECKRVLARIKEAVDEVPGVKERAGGMEGKIGGLVKWTFVRPPSAAPPPPPPATAAKQGTDESEENRGEA